MSYEAITETNNVDDLKQIIASYAKKEQVYKSEIQILKEQIRSLQDIIFGRKSEKVAKTEDSNQLSLFDLPEESFPIAEEPEEDDEIDVNAHTRKKRGRKPIPDHFPRVDEVHDLDDSEKQCECGALKDCIGEEISEQLDIIPAKAQVIRHIRLKYACKSCEGVESDGPTVTTAPMPEQLIPKCIGTPGLIAHVLIAKFVDALPFYRQEKQLLRMGVVISRATMCNWAKKIADSFELLLFMLKKEIQSGPLINVDETPVQVLNEPGKTNESKSYMWIFRGGTQEYPAIIFQYHATRSGDVASEFLCDYQGFVQTDGYSGYDFLDNTIGISHMGCWVHARRKFMSVVKAAGKRKKGKNKKTGNADIALKYIRKLYKIEKEARKLELNYDEVFKLRQEQAKPILEEFKKWLDTKVNETPPTGLLGKAISYTLNQWHRLVVYIESGYVSPDNNMAENTIRPFVIGRKNWLFSATPDGATASATLYSLIETAKANDIEPYWYFRYIFKTLPDAMTEDDYKALLPQYLDKSKLEGP